MQSIRITDVDIPATSQRLKEAATAEWWSVIRVVLEAKAVINLHREFAKKRHKQDAEDGLTRMIAKAQKAAA